MQFQSAKLSKIKTKADLLVHDAMLMKITQISIENVFQNSRKMTKESRRKEAKIENSNTFVLFSGKHLLKHFCIYLFPFILIIEQDAPVKCSKCDKITFLWKF